MKLPGSLQIALGVLACLLATGQGWRAVKPRDKGA